MSKRRTQKFQAYITDNPAYTIVPIRKIRNEERTFPSKFRWILFNAKREARANLQLLINEYYS